MREKERNSEKKGKREKKARKSEKRGEKGGEKREKEKKRENVKKEKKMSIVNYYQSAFNSQKDKLNTLAEMLEISKSGADSRYTIIDHRHCKSSCRS